jgi:hypothetical protein
MVAAQRDGSNQIDGRRLASWCASKANRIIDGLRLITDRRSARSGKACELCEFGEFKTGR